MISWAGANPLSLTPYVIQENPAGNLLSRSIATSAPLLADRNAASRRRSRCPSSKAGASADAALCGSPKRRPLLVVVSAPSADRFDKLPHHSPRINAQQPPHAVPSTHRETAGHDAANYGKVVYERRGDHCCRIGAG